VGFSSAEQMDVWRALAAILMLGELTFKPAGKDGSEVADPGALSHGGGESSHS
jgi:myosin heavy subunit